MFCCGSVDPSVYSRESSDADVYLNVYDITQLNTVLGIVGMGAHHSGVEVYDREYCFGRGIGDTGVYHIAPKTCEGHIYRESLYLGRTQMAKAEVHRLIRQMQAKYSGDSYHVVRWNCNDFAEELCKHLLADRNLPHFPQWVNRPCRSALWLLPGSTVEQIDQLDYEMFIKRNTSQSEVEEY